MSLLLVDVRLVFDVDTRYLYFFLYDDIYELDTVTGCPWYTLDLYNTMDRYIQAGNKLWASRNIWSLMGFTARSGGYLQVVLYIPRVFRCQESRKFDVGIRLNNFLE